MGLKYKKLNLGWNAAPNTPIPIVWRDENDLIVDFFLNHFAFEEFRNGDRGRLKFINCSKYSFNHCNDEGYYMGQYRITENELPWGEFYEILDGLSRELPKPEVEISSSIKQQRHFIFFFRDDTIEALAENYHFELLTESQVQFKLLQILWKLESKIQVHSEVIPASYENYESARKDISNVIVRVRKSDPLVIQDIDLMFAPTGTFQELAIANNWHQEYLNLAQEFDYHKKTYNR